MIAIIQARDGVDKVLVVEVGESLRSGVFGNGDDLLAGG